MSERPRAWVLNLDAEHELEAGRGYQATRHIREVVARERQRLIGNLVRPGDLVITPDEAVSAQNYVGAAWSPTPSALRLLESAGASAVDAPDFATLHKVNARPFTVAVRDPLVESSFAKHVADNLQAALSLLSQRAPLGWLVRRSFGAAGRGRRRIASGAVDDSERAWLEASLRRGPVVIEPWVDITVEYTRSGFVRANGELSIAPPCFQATTSAGAWTRTERADRGDVARDDDARLEAAAAAAGEALHAAGYFGPFGIDAFRHRDAARSGATVLNPMSEINARYTMDWTTAMTQRVDSPDSVRRA